MIKLDRINKHIYYSSIFNAQEYFKQMMFCFNTFVSTAKHWSLSHAALRIDLRKLCYRYLIPIFNSSTSFYFLIIISIYPLVPVATITIWRKLESSSHLWPNSNKIFPPYLHIDLSQVQSSFAEQLEWSYSKLQSHIILQLKNFQKPPSSQDNENTGDL